MKNNTRTLRLIFIYITFTLLSGCGGGGSGSTSNSSSGTTAQSTYALSGTVSGLKSGEKLILSATGADPITVSSNSTFRFTLSSQSTKYEVAVQRPPMAQACSVANGTGTVASGDINNIAVTCGGGIETDLFAFNYSDGNGPESALVEGSDGNFYGTTWGGGPTNAGTIFMITPGGTQTVLYSFQGGSDGLNPQPGLLLGPDGSFYGTTNLGGTNGLGTVFKITTAGALTTLYSFAGGGDGAKPTAGVTLGNDGNFYGTTNMGGTFGFGTVYKITPDGSEAVIYSFAGSSAGAYPNASLTLGMDGNFFGTTSYAGSANPNGGTVFKITPAGVETVLYSFTDGVDGGQPGSNLIRDSGGNFYGTTAGDGVSSFGNIFKIAPDGTFSVLYSFTGIPDGSAPTATLTLGEDGNFYGTTRLGGASGNGTIFELTPAGVETILYSFTGGYDGGFPSSNLLLGSDGYLYGETAGGGNSYGTVFKF